MNQLIEPSALGADKEVGQIRFVIWINILFFFQFGQLNFAIWTNTILQFGQINFAI